MRCAVFHDSDWIDRSNSEVFKMGKDISVFNNNTQSNDGRFRYSYFRRFAACFVFNIWGLVLWKIEF